MSQHSSVSLSYAPGVFKIVSNVIKLTSCVLETVQEKTLDLHSYVSPVSIFYSKCFFVSGLKSTFLLQGVRSSRTQKVHVFLRIICDPNLKREFQRRCFAGDLHNHQIWTVSIFGFLHLKFWHLFFQSRFCNETNTYLKKENIFAWYPAQIQFKDGSSGKAFFIQICCYSPRKEYSQHCILLKFRTFGHNVRSVFVILKSNHGKITSCIGTTALHIILQP